MYEISNWFIMWYNLKKKYKVYEIMMPIKLFVYRLRVNQYGLVSIKYIVHNFINLIKLVNYFILNKL